jgi:hypothetical protein
LKKERALPTPCSPNSPPRVRLVELVVHAAERLTFPRLIVVAIVCVVVVLDGPLGIALLLHP